MRGINDSNPNSSSIFWKYETGEAMVLGTRLHISRRIQLFFFVQARPGAQVVGPGHRKLGRWRTRGVGWAGSSEWWTGSARTCEQRERERGPHTCANKGAIEGMNGELGSERLASRELDVLAGLMRAKLVCSRFARAGTRPCLVRRISRTFYGARDQVHAVAVCEEGRREVAEGT